MGQEQWAEKATNVFADPPDVAEAEAALGPHAVRCHLPKPFMGAASCQSAEPTAHPCCRSQQGKKREEAWGSTVSSSA